VSFFNHLLLIFGLIAFSAFFSMAEISLAASRKVKLRLMAESGNGNAARVLALQESPGHFFTVVQIGLNAIAILGGILGESLLSPYVAVVIGLVYSGPWLETLSFVLSFLLVTALFVLFADLMPKRYGMVQPEQVAVAVVQPMLFCTRLFAPVVWVFNGLADRLFKVFGLPSVRADDITPDDIMAMADAGAQAGVLLNQEQHLIANVFELDSRIIPSAMTARESIVFLSLSEAEESIRHKIADFPHGKYPVCEKDGIDSVMGYVDAKDILPRILGGRKLSLRTEPIVRKILVLPDTLTLFEALERFRDAREDFAVIVNEYALVVGLLTLQDVMSTVMGDLVSPFQEELIVRRDDRSWLIDGLTPIEDVMQALDITAFEGAQNFETIAGFLMFSLRRVPKPTDFVDYAGYKFEVIDIDSHRIDQVLVTRNAPLAPDA
jgi:CBS domain containing-hemolysin-like protein